MQETNEYHLDLARQYLEEGLVHQAQGIALTFRQNAPRDADFHVEWAGLCAELGRLNNIPAYVEDTGDHSHRLWFFFQETVHFLKIKSFLKRFLKEADIFDSRFQIEPLLPTRGTGLGWVEEPLFLPLGIHRRTMRRSLFIHEEESRPYDEQLKFLKTIRPIPFSEALKGFQRYFTPGVKGAADVRLDVLTLKLMHFSVNYITSSCLGAFVAERLRKNNPINLPDPVSRTMPKDLNHNRLDH